MLIKSIVAGVAGSALLATVAVAQTPAERADKMAPAASTTTSTTTPTAYTGEWRASKVVGLSVYNDGNASVGSINELLMVKGGTMG